MPINAGYEYFDAEKKYLAAQTLEERIEGLRQMIKVAPKHKGSENLLAELKTRLKKFLEKKEKTTSVGKGKKGIRKEGFQVVLVGLPNAGKSQLLAALTNATPYIASTPFSTSEPFIGTLYFDGVSAQIVDLPAVTNKNFDTGLIHTSDCVLVVLEGLKDLETLQPILSGARGKIIYVFNKSDLLNEEGKRKLEAQLRSKRLSFVMVSALHKIGISDLKEKIVSSMNIIRIFMKEPGKPPSPIPMVLPTNSTVAAVAESIYKGYSKQIKETRLTGPSGKFSNQRVGLDHVLKDRDTVEFRTR